MKKRKEMVPGPFGEVVEQDKAIKLWRRVAKTINSELGLGVLYGFDPDLAFRYGASTTSIPRSVYEPLYLLCLEVKRLRWKHRPRDARLALYLNKREEDLKQKEYHDEYLRLGNKALDGGISGKELRRLRFLCRKLGYGRPHIFGMFLHERRKGGRK